MHREPASNRALGEFLRAMREREGLSPGKLAERLGVSRITVREAELGRDPRHSTLQSYLDTLPDITPPELLGSDEARTPPPLRSAWSQQRDLHRTLVREMRFVVTIDADARVESVLTLSGLRAPGRDPREPAVRTELMRAAFRGSGTLLATLAAKPADLRGQPRVLQDGDVTHEFRFAADLRRGGLTYVRRENEHLAEEVQRWRTATEDPEACRLLGTEVEVHHAVRRLELRVRLPEKPSGLQPRLFAWPAPVVPRTLDDELTSARRGMDPGVTLRSRAGELSARIEHPVLGLCYALALAPVQEDAAPVKAPRGESELSRVLRTARQGARLSRRGLGELMGVSNSTVAGAESGRDVRHSTLVKCVQALPGLSAWDLLRLPDDGMPLTRRVAWEYWRDLYGWEVGEDTKTVVVSREGHSKITIETRELKRVRGGRQDAHLLLGMARSVLRPSRASLESVDSSAEDVIARLRIQRIARPGAPPLHELTIPSELANAGVSFGRRLDHSGVYAMTAKQARKATGVRAEAYHEGASFGPIVPSRVLRLVVRFPIGYWPAEPRVHAWSMTQVPDRDREDLSRRLHPEGLELVVDRRRRRLEVRVEKPLIGTKYALTWQLP